MNGGRAPTSATQIKEAELNVHKETSQLNLQFHCEGAAINHNRVFLMQDTSASSFPCPLSFPPQLLINVPSNSDSTAPLKSGQLLLIPQNDWGCVRGRGYKELGRRVRKAREVISATSIVAVSRNTVWISVSSVQTLWSHRSAAGWEKQFMGSNVTSSILTPSYVEILCNDDCT